MPRSKAGHFLACAIFNRALVGSPAPLCGAETEPVETHGHAQSLALTRPPRSALFLKPV